MSTVLDLIREETTSRRVILGLGTYHSGLVTVRAKWSVDQMIMNDQWRHCIRLES